MIEDQSGKGQVGATSLGPDSVSGQTTSVSAGRRSGAMNIAHRWMNGFVRQPLFHFLLIGAALLAIDHYRRPQGARMSDSRIVVSNEVVEELRRDLSLRLGRPPRPDEESTEIERWISEEVVFRTAL